MNNKPKRGSIRAKNSNGDWIVSSPGDAYFSSVTMAATEWWDGEKWTSILATEEVPSFWPMIKGTGVPHIVIDALNDLNERLEKLEGR